MRISFLWEKIKWFWISFWGHHYRIIPTDKIKYKDEIIFYKHRIYISKTEDKK